MVPKTEQWGTDHHNILHAAWQSRQGKTGGKRDIANKVWPVLRQHVLITGREAQCCESMIDDRIDHLGCCTHVKKTTTKLCETEVSNLRILWMLSFFMLPEMPGLSSSKFTHITFIRLLAGVCTLMFYKIIHFIGSVLTNITFVWLLA